MVFSWSDRKNVENVRKHRIAFEDAVRVFDGPVITRVDDRVDYGEFREIAIGLVDGIEIVVCFTDVGDGRRIISARRATRVERETFWARIG